MRNVSKVQIRGARTRDITRRQQSLITIEQLLETGWTRAAIRHGIATGTIEAITRRVFRIAGASEGPSQRALAAVLDIDRPAAVSHSSAAFLWDVPGFRLAPIEVTTQRAALGRDFPLARLHLPTFDVTPHIVILEGVPVLTPIATVWSLATSGSYHPKRIERAIDTLWARRLLTGRTLADSINIFGKRGRRGTVLMRELAEARPPEFIAPESGLESRFQDILEKKRIRGFVRQRNLGSDVEWLGRVDFAHEKHRIVVQIDSDRFHSALLDQQADQRQTAALLAAGWQVLRFTEWQLWQDSEAITSKIRRAQELARAA